MASALKEGAVELDNLTNREKAYPLPPSVRYTQTAWQTLLEIDQRHTRPGMVLRVFRYLVPEDFDEDGRRKPDTIGSHVGVGWDWIANIPQGRIVDHEGLRVVYTLTDDQEHDSVLLDFVDGWLVTLSDEQDGFERDA